MPTLETLIEDIHALFDGHEVNEELLDEFKSNIGDILASRLRSAGNTNDGGLRMSNVGRPCARSLWYDKYSTQEREPLPASAKIKFLFGDIIEAMLLYLAKEAGHEVTDEQKEVELEGIKGHIDCKIDGILVDVKSASTYSFKKFEEGTLEEDGNDAFGYIDQLSGYKEAEGMEEAAFLAMDKTLGHLALYAPKNFSDVRSTIADRKLVMDEPDSPPPRAFDDEPEGKSGNRKLCTNCSYCAHKNECWPGVRTFVYSHKPVYLTEVKRLPKVREV